MANAVKQKTPNGEKAIARLVAQMDKTVGDREWSAIAHAKLVTYLVEATGAKFPTKEGRDEFTDALTDSDWSFSSNMKAYLVDRGFLPAKKDAKQSKYE